MLYNMQTIGKTAGETASIYNRFEQEIIRLNGERDSRIARILEDIHRLADERETLRQAKAEHHQALESINSQIKELTDRIKQRNAEAETARIECKQAKAQVTEEANAHYEKFPVENWLWKKVYRFFKKNPDVCLQILKEEGGEL